MGRCSWLTFETTNILASCALMALTLISFYALISRNSMRFFSPMQYSAICSELVLYQSLLNKHYVTNEIRLVNSNQIAILANGGLRLPEENMFFTPNSPNKIVL